MAQDAPGFPTTTDRRAGDEADERLRAFQDGIPHLAWTARADGSIDYVNRRWMEFSGRRMEDLRDWRWLDLIHPDDVARHRDEWEQAFATGKRYEASLRIRRHDGVYRWHALRDWPAHDAQGRIAQWFGTATDIDDQRQWEDRLQHTNEALEQFASIAAHDLQEPLRMVSSYLDIFRSRYAGALDDRANDYLSRAFDGTVRMKALIMDLLEFAKLDRSHATAVETDCAHALGEALANLRGQLDANGGQVTSGPLPALRMERAHLTSLLQNLIGNGLKYRRPDAPPRIHVEAARAGREWVISVSDNGLGIEEGDRERVFELFTRLHIRGDFPGTGLGLAICRKIVAAYGGRIWVEPAQYGGGGSIFRFSIPDRGQA